MFATTTYQRKNLEVQAAQVTEHDLRETAVWCGGTVKIETGGLGLGSPYIEVPGKRHQMQYAYPGDWIVQTGTIFRVYRNWTFHDLFQKAKKD